MKRRTFLKAVGQSAAVLSAARASAPAGSAARVRGANERVNLGLIGCGGRGRFLARHLLNLPSVEFVAACDVYETNRASAADQLGPRCKPFKDFRRVLEEKQVDAVIVATPDHWHAIPTVLACEAGKDVYVEKPLAHNVREGRTMVDAARRHNRIVQTGTQQRSSGHFETVRQFVRSGELGEVHFVRIWNYSNLFPKGIGRRADSEVPPGLDWDFYLGPAPKQPFNWNRFLFRYRYFWDYSGGSITDYGIHRFDSMHQIMGVDSPRTVAASGGRFSLNDGGEVPDVMQVTYEYPGFVLSYETNLLNAHGVGGRTPGREYYRAVGSDDRPHGLAFYGTNGAVFVDRIGFEIYPELKPNTPPAAVGGERRPPEDYRMQRREASAADATAVHVRAFIDCVRTRKTPVVDVETGHRSTLVAHLGNIALKTGKKLKWDGVKEEFAGDPEPSKLLGRQARKPWDLI